MKNFLFFNEAGEKEDGRQSILFNQSNFFWLNERELWALQLTPPTNQSHFFQLVDCLACRFRHNQPINSINHHNSWRWMNCEMIDWSWLIEFIENFWLDSWIQSNIIAVMEPIKNKPIKIIKFLIWLGLLVCVDWWLPAGRPKQAVQQFNINQ